MEEKKQVSLPLNMDTLLMLLVAIGLLLLVIGLAQNSKGTAYAGMYIIPFALFAGGFLMKEENNMVRLGLFLAAGLFLSGMLGKFLF